MGRFKSLSTDVVVSVDESKDDRFAAGWEPVTESKSSRTSSKK